MTTIVAVAVGIPCLILLAFFGARRIQSLPFARSMAPARGGDMRGIALQTIIIMVVLLAIAGSVAAVLLTRAGDVTSQLESQEVIPGLVTTRTACNGYRMATVAGVAATGTCTWTAGSTSASPTDVTASRCDLVRGTYTPGDGTKAAKCVVSHAGIV